MDIILPAIDIPPSTSYIGSVPGLSIPEKRFNIDPAQVETLVIAARDAASHAYSPLTEKFAVGAAIIMADDPTNQIYSSANIENSVFNAGTCAERGVLNYVIGQGFRRLKMIAVSTDHRDSDDLTLKSPCGLCRQAMHEFADDQTLIVIDGGAGNKPHILDMARLLPYGYRFQSKI